MGSIICLKKMFETWLNSSFVVLNNIWFIRNMKLNKSSEHKKNCLSHILSHPYEIFGPIGIVQIFGIGVLWKENKNLLPVVDLFFISSEDIEFNHEQTG